MEANRERFCTWKPTGSASIEGASFLMLEQQLAAHFGHTSLERESMSKTARTTKHGLLYYALESLLPFICLLTLTLVGPAACTTKPALVTAILDMKCTWTEHLSLVRMEWGWQIRLGVEAQDVSWLLIVTQLLTAVQRHNSGMILCTPRHDFLLKRPLCLISYKWSTVFKWAQPEYHFCNCCCAKHMYRLQWLDY